MRTKRKEHILYFNKKLVSVFTILTLFILNHSAYGFNTQISGYKLSMCSKENCITLKADNAYMGQYAKNYAFDRVDFILENKKSEIKTNFVSLDVYYDTETNRILFRDVQKMKFKQAIYDIDQGQLIEL